MLIAHLIHRLDIGGMETVVVNILNHLPKAHFRHAVISLTDCTDFKDRIKHPDVTFHQLDKKAGKDPMVWVRLWKLLRRLKPEVLHTCNLAALEGALPARLAGVPVVIHAEHGRDDYDLDGSNRKYLLLRQLLIPLVDHVVPVSGDLERWLVNRVRVNPTKIRKIVNGIDSPLPPRTYPDPAPAGESEAAAINSWFMIGTVGRLWPVKDQANLLKAFARLLAMVEGDKDWLRLVLVGDGPERANIEALGAELGITSQLWISGWRDDVPQLLRGFDVFALPSQAEGTPLTILEAMAAGLPVVATRVGGVADMVIDGDTGALVEPGDPEGLALALLRYVRNPSMAPRHGASGRALYEEKFTLQRMVERYESLFTESVSRKIG